MRLFLVLLFLCGSAEAKNFILQAVSACPVTQGPITLVINTPRVSGVSPYLQFFDTVGTTDTALTNTGADNPYQHVNYSWTFGDINTSGTSNWLYGSNANKNSRGSATGPIAAHLYITAGTSTTYGAVVTASDIFGNKASCGVAVTAYDMTDATHGFGSIVCQANSTLPVAGSGGCPTGASVSNSSNASLNTGSMSNKAVLFKCGDTFSNGPTLNNPTKSMLGAYGSCVGTQTGRPIFTSSIAITTGTDIRIADIDCESTGSNCVAMSGGASLELTYWNLLSNGNSASFYTSAGAENGFIQTVMTGMGATTIGTYFNTAAHNCVNGSTQYNCGGTPNFQNIKYGAMMGNSFNGQGVTGANVETWRISACRYCVISNNTSQHAGTGGAVMKLHSGNTYDTQCTWIGEYTEYIYISDNYYTGASGAEFVEIVAQNSVTDERMQYIIFERNLLFPNSAGDQLLVGVQNVSVRNNVLNNSGSQFAQRGYEYTSANLGGTSCTGGNSGAPINSSFPQYNEFFNNTCYAGNNICAKLAGGGPDAGRGATQSYAQNNLLYNVAAITPGTGNLVANNSSGTTSNPGFTNPSGTLLFMSDYQPTANYSGGTSVPNLYDALGNPWAPNWDLGAVHH